MKKIDQFDRATCKAFADLSIQAIQEVSKHAGVSVRYKGATYDPSRIVLKIEVLLEGAETPELKLAHRMMALYKIKNDTATFTSGNGTDTWTIVGFKPKSRKWPWLLRSKATGKVFKFKNETILQHFA